MIAALFDHIWQSTLFGALAGLLTLTVAGNGAHVRYGLWLAASVKFLVPFAVLSAIGAQLTPHLSPAAPDALPLTLMARQAAEPFAAATPALTAAAPSLNLQPALGALWGVGFLAVVSIRLVRWGRLRAMLRVARPLEIDAPIPARTAPTSLEPGLVGLWRPILVVPDGIAEHLEPEEFSAVIAHELCHLRRRDNLTAAVHMIVEALFWFYPPVWWLGARLIEERERACDEGVVASGLKRHVYAEGVLKVCKFYLQSPLACAAGVSGSNLSNRMENIMSGKHPASLNLPRRALIATFAGLAVATPLAAGAITSPTADTAAAEAAPSPQAVAERRYEQARPRQPVAFDAARFGAYVGFYRLSPTTIFTLTQAGGKFYAQVTNQPTFEIYPESDTKFFYTVVPAQISFAAPVGGKSPSLVLHQGGQEVRALRIDAASAKADEAALDRRIKANQPSPGTEKALRKLLTAIEAGEPNYADLTPALAATVRDQLPGLKQMMVKWGPLKSVSFKRVGPAGNDQYDVVFETYASVWMVGPLTSDNKLSTAGMIPGG